MRVATGEARGRQTADRARLRARASYRFLHDRVQEAAYALIPEAERSQAHLRIGRLLAACAPDEKPDETVFEIVHQLNRGSSLIDSIDANIIGIFIWDYQGHVVEANDALLDLVGYERGDLVARRFKWTDLIPSDRLDRNLQLQLPQLRAQGRLQPFEAEYVRKDGRRVPVLVGVASFEEASNQGVAFVLDLSERHRALEALSRAGTELAHVSRMTSLSALTASIAHEVNQPIAGIVTNASTCLRLLDAEPVQLERAREVAKRMIRDGNRAADVLSRLRALFSKRELSFGTLDLNDAAREVLVLMAEDLRRARVVLAAELASDLPKVAGDRVQLQQVILNLVRNASEAMSELHDRPRDLLITTAGDGDGVRLTVRDVGVGLSEPALASLFDAFYTTKSAGMGIGLFVCRSIVEKHRGRLWAEPNANGPGATFCLSLPRALEP